MARKKGWGEVKGKPYWFQRFTIPQANKKKTKKGDDVKQKAREVEGSYIPIPELPKGQKLCGSAKRSGTQRKQMRAPSMAGKNGRGREFDNRKRKKKRITR